ncbi:hypothetical protein LR48_Vigan01g095000 [Vigna angularis]|uniref:Uncharacterized protein n=1 Tax=Phaseolus angularis TaxID=3914 RepID=A0A0L9TLF8_PHAAN|nr:hypothetical protein LR48_Vigan01g095000 [Vigna angularis]
MQFQNSKIWLLSAKLALRRVEQPPEQNPSRLRRSIIVHAKPILNLYEVDWALLTIYQATWSPSQPLSTYTVELCNFSTEFSDELCTEFCELSKHLFGLFGLSINSVKLSTKLCSRQFGLSNNFFTFIS